MSIFFKNNGNRGKFSQQKLCTYAVKNILKFRAKSSDQINSKIQNATENTCTFNNYVAYSLCS
jgi:hypothetical protein